jgi:transcriptional regulator with XRE-family HTH domain
LDRRIAGNIRHQRLLRRWTQKRLAESLGVSFQQVQKYEQCKNRVSASMLFEIASLFGVSVEIFFDFEAESELPTNTECWRRPLSEMTHSKGKI